MQHIAPTRRARLTACKLLANVAKQTIFDVWCLHASNHARGAEGAMRLRRVWSARRQLYHASLKEATLLANLERLQRASRAAVRRDRTNHYQEKAAEAARASARNDTKELFAIARILSGAPPRSGGAIKDEAANTLTENKQVAERWTRHFAGVFCASICQKKEAARSGWTREQLQQKLEKASTWNLTVEDVAELITKLPKGKGCGPDMIPAEILQAAGPAGARMLYDLLNDIAASGYVPFEWKGGRLLPIWKKRGSPLQCSDHRGILLAPHMSKVLTGALQQRLLPQYLRHVGQSQFGCVRGRGTMAANLITRTVVDVGILTEVSVAILYVDLSKAFDVAVREILLGWPPGMAASTTREARAQHLHKCGIPADHALEVTDYIDESGGILAELGVDTTTRELMNAVHHRAWFQLEDCDDAIIVSTRGGRQGCRLGGLVFNMIYAKALAEARATMRSRGACVALRFDHQKPFWLSGGCDLLDYDSAGDDATPGRTLLQDVTYVDDEAAYLMHRNPLVLASQIRELCQPYNACSQGLDSASTGKQGRPR